MMTRDSGLLFWATLYMLLMLLCGRSVTSQPPRCRRPPGFSTQYSQ